MSDRLVENLGPKTRTETDSEMTPDDPTTLIHALVESPSADCRMDPGTTF